MLEQLRELKKIAPQHLLLIVDARPEIGVAEHGLLRLLSRLEAADSLAGKPDELEAQRGERVGEGLAGALVPVRVGGEVGGLVGEEGPGIRVDGDRGDVGAELHGDLVAEVAGDV